MKRLGTFLSIVFVCISAASAQNAVSPAAQKAMNAIDAEKIRATVKYLSDDALQGRGTGQKGGDMAADWIAAQFKSYGLAPAGDQGTYSASQFLWRDNRSQADTVRLCARDTTLPGAEKRSATTWPTAITSHLTSTGQIWTLPPMPNLRSSVWYLAGKRQTSLLWPAGNRAMNLRKPARWGSKEGPLQARL